MVTQGQQTGLIKAGRIFKVRLLSDESIRWLYTQRVKRHLNNTEENEFDIEKKWKKLTKHIKISSKLMFRNNKGTK
jgi:orotate phosphoribosyltransferase-like protein